MVAILATIFNMVAKQFFINTIMVYTHLINSMVTQRLLPIGYSYENRLHSNTEIKKNINILSPTKLTKAVLWTVVSVK
jgi:hypothetical protein